MSDFKVGDNVIITDRGQVYTTYREFAETNEIRGFVSGFMGYENGYTGTIKYIGYHTLQTAKVVVAVDLHKGGTILISPGGLKITTVVSLYEGLTVGECQGIMERILEEEEQLRRRKVHLLEFLAPLADTITKALK